ncbi:hypothetical protein [Paenirhodobacter populi]|uniref:Uncharacterized protein n=1 Tax=Paenirhodobacter populi TaxID=2306993 RepID=A0A443JD87_9RHOB|nr:hypothetical protein [Sinirhodobacter populi]RWR18519.1 hypothetical protein D2T30_16140 [Sinirhodobacter populi]
MRTISTQRISTEALAAFLGVKLETFKTWRKRGGLLPDQAPGKGKTAEWGFGDCLKAYAAKVLIEAGASTITAATFANGADAFETFMKGTPLHAPPGIGGLEAISLEDFGRELADWFCHHIAATLDPETGYGGPDAYAAAKADFEMQIRRIRGL